jgi:hypothetical protein
MVNVTKDNFIEVRFLLFPLHENPTTRSIALTTLYYLSRWFLFLTFFFDIFDSKAMTFSNTCPRPPLLRLMKK